MKIIRNIQKQLIAAAALAALLALTGCQDEIFNEIRKEVELEDSNVSGDIRSIVRYKDYLFLDNGDIYYKPITSSWYGAWVSDSKAPGDYTVKIAADSTYVYALGYTFKADYDDGENQISGKTLYYKDSVTGAWNTVATFSSSTQTHLFCTNAPQDGTNRQAYLFVYGTESGSVRTVYKLNASSMTSIATYSSSWSVTDSTCDFTVVTSASSTKPLSCVYMNSKTYFFPYLASTTNETSTAAATRMYYASGDNLYYTTADNDTSFTSKDMDTGTIRSMAYTQDFILFGTTSGFAQCPISANIPTSSSNTDFANASSTLSTSYYVNAILADKPDQTRSNNNAVYAAITFTGTTSSTSAVYDNVGLWAWYSSRGKWNRE